MKNSQESQTFFQSQNINNKSSPIDDDNLIPKPEFLKALKHHSDTISMVAFNSNNKQLITSSNDSRVMIWDITSDLNPNRKPLIGEGHKSLINDIAIAPNGFSFATASSDHTVRIWSNLADYSSNYNGKIQSQVLKFNSTPVKSVDYSCDSRLICTGADDKTIKIITVADKKMQANLTGHQNWVKCVRFNKDSKLIASGSDDRTLKLWDVYTKKLCFTFQSEHKGAVNSVRFHPDNSLLASACYDSKIRLFDVRSKQMVQTYNFHKGPATCVSFHNSGNYLASSSYDETVKIYDLRMGDILFTLSAHEGAIFCVNFSHFGDYMATGGLDNTIMLWKTNLEYYNNLGNDSRKIVVSQMKNGVSGFNNTNFSKCFPNTKSGGKFNYKNQMAEEKIGINNKENASECLTKLFEKMVNQMEIVTGSFVNFEKRVNKVEEMIDEVNRIDLGYDEQGEQDNIQKQEINEDGYQERENYEDINNNNNINMKY